MTNPNQLISIIIPVFNESESIGYLLDEVLNVMCSNKLNFEIVVVNDGSQDSTSNVLDELTIKIRNYQSFHFEPITDKQPQWRPALIILMVKL